MARFAAWACTSGPYCARPVTPGGGWSAVTVPQRSHARACTWYSVTFGGGGGAMSNTWSRWTPVTPAPARSAPHSEHAPGAHTIVTSGSATCCSVDDCAPGCLPGGRLPRSRRERSRGLFAYGLSDDGGRDEFDESFPSRRSSSATRAASASTCAASTVT